MILFKHPLTHGTNIRLVKFIYDYYIYLHQTRAANGLTYQIRLVPPTTINQLRKLGITPTPTRTYCVGSTLTAIDGHLSKYNSANLHAKSDSTRTGLAPADVEKSEMNLDKHDTNTGQQRKQLCNVESNHA